MEMDILFNTTGVIGTIIILAAYFMLESDKISSKQMCYPVMNLVGAVLLLISLMWSWNLPSVVIEVCWIAISLAGIIRINKKQKTKDE